MKRIYLSCFLLFLAATCLQAQKTIAEGTIYYDIVINTNNDSPKAADMLDGATNVIYLKGSWSRADMISSLGTQSTIIDGKTGTATILKEYGDQKYMIPVTAEEWKEYNKKNDEVTYDLKDEVKTIAGYKCRKAIGKLGNGTSFTVYYTEELVPANKDFQNINKNLPGLAMQYEAEQGKTKITYTVSSIDFGAVSASKFDLPESGYRIIPFKESIKKK